MGKIVVRRLTTNAGFLEASPIEFHDGLNCIIGARGTCKSTIVETLRFAFDVDVDGTGIDKPGAIIEATLRAGTAHCDVEIANDNDGGVSRYTFERERGGGRRVYEDGVKLFDDSPVGVSIEVFSQSDLQKIAADENQQLRLALVERPAKLNIDRLKAARANRLSRLNEIGGVLRTLRSEIVQRRDEIRDLAGLRSQLQATRGSRPQLSEELAEEHQSFQRRQRTLGQFEVVQDIQTRILDSLRPIPALKDQLSGMLQELSSSTESADALGGLNDLVRSAEAILDEMNDIRRIDLASEHRRLAAKFEELNRPYFELRQEQQAMNESLKQEETFRRQIEHLERSEQKLSELKSQETLLIAERREVRNAVRDANDEVFRIRAQEVDQINQEHGATILLTLNQASLSSDYNNCLRGLLEGSRLKTQDDLAKEIAQRFSPSEFIDHIEAGDAKELAEALNRDIGQMTRVVAHLRDHHDLYSLELQFFEDTLEITFYDNGEPKPVQALSKGQRATALLPLILRPSAQPLIFDQPEDDLDNSFIYRSLVGVIRTLRQHRQLILVTHNANIPVLGEADRVIVMKMMSPNAAAPPLSGSVDDCKENILTLLEGGKEAFERRRGRYAELLNPGKP